jgi:hypothetical protein
MLLLLLAVGVVIADDFGKSWDEYVHAVYARQTLEIYEGSRAPGDVLMNLGYYGPFYSAVTEIVKGPLRQALPEWGAAEARHFMYFLSFVLAVACLYRICRRYSDRVASLAATALFATQPVLFGHAFINPKDIPFMGFFLASMAAGLAAVDAFTGGRSRETPNAEEPHSRERQPAGLVQAWAASSPGFRWSVLILLGVFLVAVVDFFSIHWILNRATHILTRLYHGEGSAVGVRLFHQVAEDALKTPLEAYLSKLQTAYFRLRWLVLAGILGLLIAFLRSIYRDEGFRRWWTLLGAGMLTGLVTAIRIQGLLAGVLVSLLLAWSARRKAIPALPVFWTVTIAVAFAAWPSLWGHPIQNFARTLFLMLNFEWPGAVLYRGVIYNATSLPWHYLPSQILLQMTLPALGLAIAGLMVAAVRRSRRLRKPEGFVLLAWAVLPIAYLSLPDKSVYDSFRQVLFALPPVFVFASLALQTLRDGLRSPAIYAGIVALCLVPGVTGIIGLHPYEYVYYNELIGGVRGAYGKYELDYWCTGSREAMERLNAIAPPGATVGINKETDQLVPYAREDLVLVPDGHPSDYIIMCRRAGFAPIAPGPGVVLSVERSGVPLVTVESRR